MDGKEESSGWCDERYRTEGFAVVCWHAAFCNTGPASRFRVRTPVDRRALGESVLNRRVTTW